MTIYPIGIDNPCKSWKKNNLAKDEDLNESSWIPNTDVQLNLIEEPIEIKK